MITETRLRELIREEISRALGILAREAQGADGYGTGELESAGLRAVRTAAEVASGQLDSQYHHEWCMAWKGKPCDPRCDNVTGEDN